MESLVTLTRSEKETIQLGKALGKLLQEGDVVGLVGELGCGKTCLAKGIGLGLGLGPDEVITSPSFTLVNEYQGRLKLYHMDVYRLNDVSEFLGAGLEEYLYEPAVVVLEWADKWPEILPEHRIMVELSIIGDFERRIVLSGGHPRAVQIIEALERHLARNGP
ncbi:MAG: tRNA (adenosine(37)-N6)-threonylcarbamoyltransferase complex ATPase subunit type 1 TsaE, partial [Deltaproteobacteria bacterium]|nr:tRNA (adenosine(37)-N6)-threonylcarbamoyltransferase complex ATPase subunit type 1 TsaE [Deltaproteobacteria bacterium]